MTTGADAQDASPVTLAAARAEFDADVTYLDTATFGLPLAAARSSYAGLVGVDPSAVAVGSQVSVFARLIAANLPDGSEVLTATGDFTSILLRACRNSQGRPGGRLRYSRGTRRCHCR